MAYENIFDADIFLHACEGRQVETGRPTIIVSN